MTRKSISAMLKQREYVRCYSRPHKGKHAGLIVLESPDTGNKTELGHTDAVYDTADAAVAAVQDIVDVILGSTVAPKSEAEPKPKRKPKSESEPAPEATPEPQPEPADNAGTSLEV